MDPNKVIIMFMIYIRKQYPLKKSKTIFDQSSKQSSKKLNPYKPNTNANIYSI